MADSRHRWQGSFPWLLRQRTWKGPRLMLHHGHRCHNQGLNFLKEMSIAPSPFLKEMAFLSKLSKPDSFPTPNPCSTDVLGLDSVVLQFLLN